MVSIIVAYTKNRVIGNKGLIPWNIKGEQKRFKELTSGEALPLADRLYITVIDAEIEGDTYFPEFNEEDFIKTFEEKHEGDIGYTYYNYERIN
jgi:dihydrofolate reductase